MAALDPLRTLAISRFQIFLTIASGESLRFPSWLRSQFRQEVDLWLGGTAPGLIGQD